MWLDPTGESYYFFLMLMEPFFEFVNNSVYFLYDEFGIQLEQYLCDEIILNYFVLIYIALFVFAGIAIYKLISFLVNLFFL